MQSAQVVTPKPGQQNASSLSQIGRLKSADSKSPMQYLSFVQAQHYRVAFESVSPRSFMNLLKRFGNKVEGRGRCIAKC
jgi:hypothetical protein